MRLLVIEDETSLREQLGGQLRAAGYAVDSAANGKDGLLHGREYPVDLAIVDLGLPDISGMELLRHLKADARTEGVPVVVVSADALAQQIDAAFEAGCAHYLTKPVNVAELLAVVDDLLEQMDTQFG